MKTLEEIAQIIEAGAEIIKDGIKKAAVAMAFVSAATVVSLPWTGPHLSRDVYEHARVTDKTVKRSGNKDTYLVFAKFPDNSVKVFENKDSLLEFKFDSSNVQGKVEVGREYTIRTYGFRIPMMSMYENILGVEEVKK